MNGLELNEQPGPYGTGAAAAILFVGFVRHGSELSD